MSPVRTFARLRPNTRSSRSFNPWPMAPQNVRAFAKRDGDGPPGRRAIVRPLRPAGVASPELWK